MTSEIRVNKITHTAGVGTVTTNTHGIVVSGIVTATTFKGNVEATTGSFSGNLGVGGVLTYEDVTNVDSVGIITARSTVSIADSIIHTGDTNTSLRFPAADTITAETAGSERIRITNTGNIGIGIDNPSADYRVTIKSSTSPHSALLLDTTESNYNTNLYFAKQGTNKWIIGNKASDDAFRILSGTTERLRIKNDGKLNITPGGALSGSYPPGDLNIVGTNFLTMTPNDNTNASDNEVLGQISFLPYGAGSLAAASAKIEAVAESGQSGSANPTSLRFYTKPSSAGPGSSGNERMKITSSGCLHVGNVGYGDKNYRFDVEGGIACEGSGAGTGRYGTIYSNFGGDSGNRQVGSYTIHSGQMAMHGNGARYMHIKFDIAAGAMWYIKIEGYEYIGNWTSTVNGSTISNDKVHYSLSGGYIYNNNAIFNGKAVAHRGITPTWYLDGNDLCVYIDTNSTNSTNRWGFYRFSGGHDGIVGRNNAYPLAIVAYSFSTGTSNPF